MSVSPPPPNNNILLIFQVSILHSHWHRLKRIWKSQKPIGSNIPNQDKLLKYLSILRPRKGSSKTKNLMHLPVNIALKLYIFSNTGNVEMGEGYLLIPIRPVWTWQRRYLWFTSVQALSISDNVIYYWDAQIIPQISTNKSIQIHEASISKVSLYFIRIRLKASPSKLFWVNALFPSISKSNR